MYLPAGPRPFTVSRTFGASSDTQHSTSAFFTHTHTHTHTPSHMYIRQYSTVVLSHNSLAQDGSTALLLASYGGSVEVVRMLLKEFNSSLDEVNNVSVYFTICITALKQSL